MYDSSFFFISPVAFAFLASVTSIVIYGLLTAIYFIKTIPRKIEVLLNLSGCMLQFALAVSIALIASVFKTTDDFIKTTSNSDVIQVMETNC